MILHKDLILRRKDNPHELLIAKCANCKERRDDTRIKLHLDGWTVLTGSFMVEDFLLCDKCSGREEVVMNLEDESNEEFD